MGSERLRFVQVSSCRSTAPLSIDSATDRKYSNGCGLDIGVKAGKVVGVRGRATDRVNKGRLGPKGMNGYVLGW
jgi:anaerobic selenocysteine-containing dehydrogenase